MGARTIGRVEEQPSSEVVLAKHRSSTPGCSTPSTSRQSPAARPTSRTPSGLPSCSSMACVRASFVPRANPRPARPHPLPQGAHPGAYPRGPAPRQGPPGCWRQAQFGGLGRARGLRASDARRARRGHPRSCPFHLVDSGTLGPAAALGHAPLIRRTPSVDHLGSARNPRGVGSSAPRRMHRPATST